MKKILFLGLVAIFGLIDCSRNQEIDVPDANLSLIAKTESSTDSRTVVEGEVHVYWEPGDEIMVFNGEKSAKFTTDITSSSASATFKGTFGEETWPEDLDLWAVYPFSEDAVFDGETITTTLPSEQVAREGSFGKDMNLAIAHSSGTTLQFYNVGGGIRFSVTEEGIKKVMFEGLSGEIISGKVKIGFEEGLPVVKEVTGGSQFITLLPPAGQGTFEPGAWYYIVAIPGSLEGGYKLRFYKDSDYARRVSEKAVQIKRSIYGNIEKADEGIEYEATTTHFPETKEEWETSIELTNSISNSVNNLIASMQDEQSDEFVNVNGFVTQVLNIEGVSDAFTVGDNIGAVIIQENGVHINVVLNHSDDDEEESDLNTSSAPIMKTMRKSVPTPSLSSKQALLITPYYSSSNGLFRQIWVDVESYYNDLQAIGYTPHWAPDEDATVRVFSPAILSQYDLVIIATHGNYEGFKDQEGNDVGTILMTGSEVGSIDWDSASYKKLAAFITTGKAKKVDRYAVSAQWFEGVEEAYGVCASFNGTLVMAMACDSYHKDDLANYFTSRNSPFFYGNITSVKTANMGGVSGFVKYLCMGMSAQNAVETMREYDFVYQKGDNFPGKIDDPQGPIYLIDPTPSNLHNSEIRDSKTTLIWDQAKTIGDYRFKVHLKWPNSNSYSTYSSTTSKAYTTDVLQPGEYSWYVEANLYYDGKVVETFISDAKTFTVEEVGKAIIEILDDDYFAYCRVGQNKTVSYTIKNKGDAALVISGVYFQDDDMTGSFNWTTATINPNESKELVVTFSPLNTGPHRPSIQIYSNASNPNYDYSFKMNYFSFDCYGQHATPSYSDEMVDLGLSVKWAACDLGTNSQYDYGEHYAWGETNRKDSYSWDNYMWCNGSESSITKYGYYDGPNVLESSDDAATSHLGAGWRIPTEKECQELIDNCIWKATEKNGIPVFEVTSRNTGESIVFMRWKNAVGQLSEYWTRNLWSDDAAFVFALSWYGDGEECNPDIHGMSKCAGALIRPVYDDPASKPSISASPTSINYGNVKVGEALGNATGRVTFTNTGGSDLLISRFDCPDGFSHSSAYTFPIVISPGNDRTIVFAFKPTEAKTYSGYVKVYSNASNGVCTVKVTGNGVE